MSARFSYGPGASTRCLKWHDGALTTSRTRRALATARFSISRSSGVTYSIAIRAKRDSRLGLRFHRDIVHQQTPAMAAQQFELRVHRREPADLALVPLLRDGGEKSLRIAALDIFDQRQVLALDPLRDALVGAEIVSELASDVRKIHSRHDQHAPALALKFVLERRNKPADALVADRRLAAHNHLVERANQDRHNLLAFCPQPPCAEQRLELYRMLVAMQQLFREQLALRVARREPPNQIVIGLDRAERSHVALARRREQLRTHPGI